MTEPAAETIESEKDKLVVTDTELIRRLGVPAKIGRAAIHDLDKHHPGRPKFPQKDPPFGNRRFWPAVEKYLMLRHGVTDDPFMPAAQWQEKRNATAEAGETGPSGDARARLETLERNIGPPIGFRGKTSSPKAILSKAVSCGLRRTDRRQSRPRLTGRTWRALAMCSKWRC